MERYHYRVTIATRIEVTKDVEVMANNANEAGQIACETASDDYWEPVSGPNLCEVETISVERVQR